jgi:hypothetical protein
MCHEEIKMSLKSLLHELGSEVNYYVMLTLRAN